MAYFTYGVKVPKERVAVLIGKKGETKKQIEEATKTKLSIDSDEGDVKVEGEDPLNLYITRDLIKAIGRGFNPDIAMLLLKQDYVFEMMDVSDYANTQKAMLRLKGRIIGKDGKSRKIIESLTETYICVFGKTIGIIGEGEAASIARRAIESLLAGSPHSSVYKWLEKRNREIKQRDFEERKMM